jgi:hypothetical protein
MTSIPIVVGRADMRGSFRQATWYVLPRDFYGNHIPGFQERICSWYEVDYLPALSILQAAPYAVVPAAITADRSNITRMKAKSDEEKVTN